MSKTHCQMALLMRKYKRFIRFFICLQNETIEFLMLKEGTKNWWCLHSQGPCRREIESILSNLKISNILNPRGFRIPNCDKKGFYKKKQVRKSIYNNLIFECFSSAVVLKLFLAGLSTKAKRMLAPHTLQCLSTFNNLKEFKMNFTFKKMSVQFHQQTHHSQSS